MKTDYTDITIILDRSGSMKFIKEDMEGGFSEFIKTQKEIADDTRISLNQFDDKFETVFTEKPLSEVESLNLVPRNMTALLDAIGKTINEVGQRLSNKPESERPANVLVIIITDGQENCSTEFSRDQIFEMIKTQTEVYKWTFTFLGANQDAIAVGTSLGVSAANSLTYSDPKQMFNAVSRGSNALRSSGMFDGYSTEDRQANS